MDPRAPAPNHRISTPNPLGPAPHVSASAPSPPPHTHWVLGLHVLTRGSPTTQLTDPGNPTTGAHTAISKHPDPSPLRPQIQHRVLDPQTRWRIPDPHASSPGSPSSPTGFWIPRSLSHRIPDPLTPATGFLNSFALTLSPGSLCFDYWIPYISTTTPSTPNHRISDSQALTGWILASKSTM